MGDQKHYIALTSQAKLILLVELDLTARLRTAGKVSDRKKVTESDWGTSMQYVICIVINNNKICMHGFQEHMSATPPDILLCNEEHAVDISLGLQITPTSSE